MSTCEQSGKKIPFSNSSTNRSALFEAFSKHLRQEISRDLFRFEMMPQRMQEAPTCGCSRPSLSSRDSKKCSAGEFDSKPTTPRRTSSTSCSLIFTLIAISFLASLFAEKKKRFCLNPGKTLTAPSQWKPSKGGGSIKLNGTSVTHTLRVDGSLILLTHRSAKSK